MRPSFPRSRAAFGRAWLKDDPSGVDHDLRRAAGHGATVLAAIRQQAGARGDRSSRPRAEQGLSNLFFRIGDPSASLELATGLATPWKTLLVLDGWACAELEGGDLAAAGDLAGRVLALARIEREAGALDAAEASLATAERLATAHEHHGLRVAIIGEGAELLAARGDHAGAHETHLRFHAETLERGSAACEARARTLHAMLEVDTARREGARCREMSYRDPLTALLNRRHVDEDLDHRPSRGATLAVAMLDLDHFIRINDACSHEAGDHVLVRLATTSRDASQGRADLLRRADHHLYAAKDNGRDRVEPRATRPVHHALKALANGDDAPH